MLNFKYFEKEKIISIDGLNGYNSEPFYIKLGYSFKFIYKKDKVVDLSDRNLQCINIHDEALVKEKIKAFLKKEFPHLKLIYLGNYNSYSVVNTSMRVITFYVPEDGMSYTIGKDGENLKRIKTMFNLTQIIKVKERNNLTIIPPGANKKNISTEVKSIDSIKKAKKLFSKIGDILKNILKRK